MRGVLRRPSPFVGEPDRARKMMKRDHWLDALLAQLAQDVAIVADLARVEGARRWLDPRPLDRQPMSGLVQLAQQREILAGAGGVVGRNRRRLAVGGKGRVLLGPPPTAGSGVAPRP